MDNSKILAVVGGASVTENDVMQMIASMGAKGQQYANPQGQAMILEQLIVQKLFLADAKRNMMEYDPGFKAELARVKDDLLFQFAVGKALEKVTVSDEDARKFFNENPDQFAGQKTVSASHILVSEESKANELLEKIQAGEISFEDAAKQNSSCPSGANGGSLGEFGRGQMVKEFEDACFSMEIGEIRGPIKTQFGYHLIRLDSAKDAEPVKFEDAKPAIMNHLIGEKRQQAYQSKINQLKIMYPVDRR